jgi:hypothetical protein
MRCADVRRPRLPDRCVAQQGPTDRRASAESSTKAEREGVLVGFGDPVRIGMAQVSEHPRAAVLDRLVGHPWDEMEMHVGESLRLAELHHVRLQAPDLVPQRNAQPVEERAELRGSLRLQIRDRREVLGGQQHQPTW